MRLASTLLAASLLLPATAALAEEEPDIEFFYPVVTRRPVIERELELRMRHEKSREGRQTETTAAIEVPLLPRWQLELELPFLIGDPREGPSVAGFGDLEIENKFLLWKSVEHRALVAAGFELKLPSGSERRGLGGELAIEPFLSAGIALGPFDVLGNIAYEWTLNRHVTGQREQELTANLAVAYPVSRWFTPFLELDSVTRTSGSEDGDAPRLRDRLQLYLTPGFNVRALPGLTFRAGVELPVTDARQFDYRVHAGLVWEF
jgi:Putative MetA-pathway of phenol degradation